MKNFFDFLFKRRQVVTAGRVTCPETGEDVDIDRCGACPNLESVDGTTNPDSISCRTSEAAPEGEFKAS